MSDDTYKSVRGRKLSVKLSGVGRLISVLKDGAYFRDPALEYQIADWESLEQNVPHRCIIRCDGHIQDWRTTNPDLGNSGAGYPCGVLRIDYSIGGYQIGGSSGDASGQNASSMRTLFVDCVNQSALVVWATSIQVTPVWDKRRIERLAQFFSGLESEDPGPVRLQHCAAAISVDDYGPANARWLDVITFNNEDESDTVSVHPIPPGARACILRNATLVGSDNIAEIEDYLTHIQWANYPTEGSFGTYIHQDPVSNGHCALDVPAGASHLFLRFAQVADTTLKTPFWVEWILSPEAI